MTPMPMAQTHPRLGRATGWKVAVCAIAAAVLVIVFLGAAPAQAQVLEVGESETFWAQDWTTRQYLPLSATAKYVGEHVAIFVDDQESVSTFLVDELGQAFDSVIFPTLTDAYGSEPNPGLDADSHVVILIYDFKDPLHDVDASFNPPDIDPHAAYYSNQKEMFYLNSQALLAETDSGPALAAHEFAHLIIQYQDTMLDSSPDALPESTWVAEGLTTYAEHLCGYDRWANSKLQAFTSDPNFSLTLWQGVRANYGASYSFVSYLAQREGADFIRALVHQPLDGISGVDATLQASGSSATFASLFDDWVLAGFLDSHLPPLAPYFFDQLSVSVAPVEVLGTPPLLGTSSVVDYGARYLDFPACSTATNFQAVVDGADGAPLQAALISWDSTGELAPSIDRFDLDNSATGGTVTGSKGYDRHTLVVWARGIVGSADSYTFTYSGTTDPPGGIQFLDMGGGDPFYRYVASLLPTGIVSGREIPSGSKLWFFKGGDDVTRAQFAKMIMTAIGLHTPDVDNVGHPHFVDVREFDATGYPYDYVEEAAALHIVTGYGDGRFAPYNPITRVQLVLMITRGAAAALKPLPPYTGSARIFADIPPSYPYYRQIMSAYVAGIFTGSPPGPDGRQYFYPSAAASRNQVAKMTANLVALLPTL